MDTELPTIEQAAPAAPVKPIDPDVQATIERNDYLKMLNECIPTLKAELHAAMFMRAFLMQAGDTHVHRAHFMKSAGRITGGLPPMTETALQIIRAAQPAKKRK